MPVFFVNTDGSLGVPVLNAAAGQMQLHRADLPPQIDSNTAVTIRINVRVRSFLLVPITHRIYRSGRAMSPSNSRCN
jgi:hypothetical protein